MQLSEEFMNAIRPMSGLPMSRLGRNFDGGYVLPIVALNTCDTLVSLGYGHDSSFEINFLSLSLKNRVLLYDSSINLTEILKQLSKSFLLFAKGRKSNLIPYVKQLIKYLLLRLNPRIKYTIAFIGSTNGTKFLSFSNLLKANSNSNVILKIDIEGSEYECFESPIELANNVKCMVIEFHNLDTRKSEFLRIINEIKANFTLVNTHINNFGPVINQLPTVIELCFIQSSLVADQQLYSAPKIPSFYDFPNNMYKDEITYEYQ